MDRSLHIPLNLSKTEQGAWLIQIESTLNSTTCHKCGQEITELHCHDEAIRLRHLPIFEIPVYVEIRPKRFRCLTVKLTQPHKA